MPRPKYLVDENTVARAEEALSSIRDAKMVIQLKAILACRDHPVAEVADILRVSKRSIFRWINRFREGGKEALRDRPKGHRRSKLSEAQWKEVEKWVLDGKTAQGEPILWTIQKVRTAIKKEFGVSMSKTPVWRQLKRMNLAPRRPRPRHAKADPAAQAAFKKTLLDTE